MEQNIFFSTSELTASLQSGDASDRYCDKGVTIGDLRFSHPYNFPIPLHMALPPGLWESQQVCRELFSTEQFPQNWLDFFRREVAPHRIARGIPGPVDIIEIVCTLQEFHPELMENAGVEALPFVPGGPPDVRDRDALIARVNAILDCTHLRSQFVRLAIEQTPGSCPHWHSRYSEVKLLERLGITGPLIDIGCGTSEGTQMWSTQIPTTIGVDRQVNPFFLDEWKKSSPIILAQARGSALPFPAEFAQVVVMEFTISYMTLAELQKTVEEAARVLMGDGLLIVCPQDSADDYDDWRFFRKIPPERNVVFKEVRRSDLETQVS